RGEPFQIGLSQTLPVGPVPLPQFPQDQRPITQHLVPAGGLERLLPAIPARHRQLSSTMAANSSPSGTCPVFSGTTSSAFARAIETSSVGSPVGVARYPSSGVPNTTAGTNCR